MDGLVHMSGRQGHVNQLRQLFDSDRKQVLQPGTDHGKGQIKDKSHDGDKHGNCRIFPRENPIKPLAAQMFLALMGFHHAIPADLVNKGKAHIGHGSASIQSALLLHLEDHVLQQLSLVLIERKLFQNQGIPFHQFSSREANRKPCSYCVILNQVNRRMQAAMNRSAVVIRAAKILPQRLFLIARHMNRVPYKLVHTLVFNRRNGDHRNAQEAFHSINVDRTAVACHLIHHVERNHHRNIHLQKLHRQIEISLDIIGIDDVDNCAGFFIQNKVPGYQFLSRIGRHGINSWEIRDKGIGLSSDHTVLSIHRDAGEVSDMLVGAGELIKKRCLPTVLITHQRESEFRPLRERISCSLGMEFSLLPQAGMRRLTGTLARFLPFLRSIQQANGDFFCVSQPQGQFIAMDPHFHRIPHRRKLDQRQLRAGDHAHIQKMLSKGALAADRLNPGALPGLQIPDRHSHSPE